MRNERPSIACTFDCKTANDQVRNQKKSIGTHVCSIGIRTIVLLSPIDIVEHACVEQTPEMTIHIRIRTSVAIGLATNRVSTTHEHVSSLWYSDNWRSNNPNWRSNNPQNGRNIQEPTLFQGQPTARDKIHPLRATQTCSASAFYNVTAQIAVPRPTQTCSACAFYNVTAQIAVPRPTKLFQLMLFYNVTAQIAVPRPTKTFSASAFYNVTAQIAVHWKVCLS